MDAGVRAHGHADGVPGVRDGPDEYNLRDAACDIAADGARRRTTCRASRELGRAQQGNERAVLLRESARRFLSRRSRRGAGTGA